MSVPPFSRLATSQNAKQNAGTKDRKDCIDWDEKTCEEDRVVSGNNDYVFGNAASTKKCFEGCIQKYGETGWKSFDYNPSKKKCYCSTKKGESTTDYSGWTFCANPMT